MAGQGLWRGVIALCAGLGAVVLAGAALAHEGHDHGAAPPPRPSSFAPRVEAASAELELVGVLRDGKLILYLDRFADNAPVAGASIEVDTPAGTLAAVPVEAGTYVLSAPFLNVPGPHDLAFTVTVDGNADLLLATLSVPAPANAARPAPPAVLAGLGMVSMGVLAGVGVGFLAGVLVMRRRRGAAALALLAGVLGLASIGAPVRVRAAEVPPAMAATTPRDVAQRLPDGAVIMPKASQRILGVRTVVTAAGSFPRTLELPGRIVADPNASGLVQAAVGGRIAPPPGGFKPLGSRVEAGDVLAYVHPPIGASDLKDLEQQGYELDQQIALVKRRYERLSAIPDAVTRRDVEEAQIELNGLRTRRATLERVQREPEALRAPVAGVIATSDAVAGQMADPTMVVFRILDPARLWVEALSFSPEAGRAGAEARTADGRTLKLAYRGAGLSERNPALPVQFAIEGDATGLRPGQLVTVLAATGEARPGIALPRAAVVRGGNGQAIVYEHVGAERFVPREVKAEPLDAGRVLVTAGLEPGRRVVSTGAELIDQIR